LYHPTTRVLTVLELLQTRGRLQAVELAERLEVDQRSVRRYITMLQDLGVPVVGERGRHGGYRLRPGFKLPPLMFNDDEALAVTLGLLAVRRLGLTAAAPAVEGALAKIERVLPAVVGEQVQAIQETLAFDLPPVEAPPAAATVRAFSNAASQQRRLRIGYRSAEGASTERTIDPYGLVYRLGVWYAVGWCHLRQAERVFRLDRVGPVEPLDEIFAAPPDFDCRAFVQQSLATMPNVWAIEVCIDSTEADARRLLPPTVGTLESLAEGVLLRCQVDNLEQTALHLLRLPWPFTVRQPPELLEAFRRLAERCAALADQGALTQANG
jgi:predicted DNA-binding transcriptional regulator YafY